MASRSMSVEFAPSIDPAFDQLWLKVQRRFSQPQASANQEEMDDFDDEALDIRHSSIQSLVVTSWTDDEGATTVAAGLAARAAGNVIGDVCLVDADFRNRPTCLTQMAGLSSKPGLSELMNDNADLEELIVPASEQGLYFLPTGKIPSGDTVITDTTIQRIIQPLEERFRYVFFDTSCLKTGVEAYRWGRFVVNAILVIGAGAARRQTVAHAVTSMQLQGMEILGMVLNRRVDSIPGWLYPYL